VNHPLEIARSQNSKLVTMRINKTILVYRTAALGDFILTIPALLRLRELFPRHKIIFITLYSSNKSQRNLVKQYLTKDQPEWIGLLPDGVIDDVLVIKEPNSVLELMRIRRVLSSCETEFIVCMVDVCAPLINRLKKFLFLKAVAPFSRIVGLGDPGYRFWKNHLKLRKKGLLEHHVYGPMQYISDLGIGSVYEQKIKFLIKIENTAVQEINRMLGTISDQPFICISFGAIKSHKKWPLDSFRVLISKIIKGFPGFYIVLVGTKNDVVESNQIAKVGERLVNLTGQLSIQQLAALFSISKLVVSNDGGSAHLADAVGCTVVSITPGIELIRSIEPFNNQPLSIRTFPDCYPCYNFDSCKTKTNKCIRDISVELVYNKVWQVLSYAK
jgi:heptosyltransferase-2